MEGAILALDGLTLRFVRGDNGAVIGADAMGLDQVLPKSGRRETYQ